MSRQRSLLALIVVLLVSVFATSALAGRAVIRTSGQTWSPSRVTVDRGSRVVWRATTLNHTVRAYGGGWRFFDAISATGNPTASRVFNSTGRFKFRCTIHSTLTSGVCNGMCGRVRVTA
jgi:plastocyanin